MRCYVSSMACLVAGGVYGVIRTVAATGRMARIHPLVAYSVNGACVRAFALFVGLG